MKNGNTFVVLNRKTPFMSSGEIWNAYGPMSQHDAEKLVEKLRQKETTIFCSVAVGNAFLSELTERARESLAETIRRL